VQRYEQHFDSGKAVRDAESPQPERLVLALEMQGAAASGHAPFGRGRCAGEAHRRIGLLVAANVGIEVIDVTAGPCRRFRSSAVVGRQPKRRQVSATEVATADTYRNEGSRIE
jgi:hypothetical protein